MLDNQMSIKSADGDTMTPGVANATIGTVELPSQSTLKTQQPDQAILISIIKFHQNRFVTQKVLLAHKSMLSLKTIV